MSATIPTPLLAAAGLAAATIDEARRLPTRLIGLPVVAVSTALQASMKVQQRYSDLVVRGDALLGQLRTTPDEAPPWARFDDDLPVDDLPVDNLPVVDDLPVDDLPVDDDFPTDGLAPAAVLEELAEDDPVDPIDNPVDALVLDTPEPPLPGYDDLTVPQLRGRLRLLSADQVEALLAYEEAGPVRAPFLTMLTNRLETLRRRG